MTEKMIDSNGALLCAESFGSPNDPPILLIMGAMASMIWWDEAFCRRLADKGRYVIRYDNRDVGRSTAYPPGELHYSVKDMTDDAMEVLNGYGLERAHLVGMSLGGMIAQLAAVIHPQRVSTLTMMMSSLYAPYEEELPSIDERILQYHANSAQLDWSDEAAVTRYLAEGWRLLGGSSHPFDEQRAMKLAADEVKRANSLLSMFNHALLQNEPAYDIQLDEIKAPALVIHGTEDPVLPYAHGLALARSIPGASLLTLEGTGHEIPKGDWDVILDAILLHTSGKS